MIGVISRIMLKFKHVLLVHYKIMELILHRKDRTTRLLTNCLNLNSALTGKVLIYFKINYQLDGAMDMQKTVHKLPTRSVLSA